MLGAEMYKWTESGPGVLGAGTAEMDFGTAPAVACALRRAIEREQFGYLTPAVSLEARVACAQWQCDNYGWNVQQADVQLLPDILRALHIAVEHFSRPGAPVIVPTPAYPPFLRVPGLLGRPVVEMALVSSDLGYTYDLDLLGHLLAGGGRLLLLCNPHNPTGRVFDAIELAAISEVVERHDGRVFADEVHAPIVYRGHRHVPYASVSPAAAAHTLTATSASKGWNLPGLKCAQVVLSNDADRGRWWSLNRLATDGTSTLGAIAATAAYRHGRSWLHALLGHLDRNRRLLGDLLSASAIRYTPPDGTYLGWLDCRKLALGDVTPGRYFAQHAEVSTLDGAECGEGGTGHVRLNFATSRSILTTIAARLAAAQDQL